MTELSDRLSALADDATRGVELPTSHALRSRRRRRRKTRFVVAALTVTAATVAVVVAVLPVRDPTTEVATLPSPTTTPLPLSQISSIAVAQAKGAGDPSPQRGEVVATTLQEASRLLGQSRTPDTSSTPIYLVVLTGRFRCETSCFGVSSPSPTGSTLILMLARPDLDIQSFGLSDQALDLARLGLVYSLDLPETVIVPNMVAMTVSQAELSLLRLGLVISTRGQPSSEFPRGVVIDQQPQAGSQVALGLTVTVIVSQGP